MAACFPVSNSVKPPLGSVDGTSLSLSFSFILNSLTDTQDTELTGGDSLFVSPVPVHLPLPLVFLCLTPFGTFHSLLSVSSVSAQNCVLFHLLIFLFASKANHLLLPLFPLSWYILVLLLLSVVVVVDVFAPLDTLASPWYSSSFPLFFFPSNFRLNPFSPLLHWSLCLLAGSIPVQTA